MRRFFGAGGLVLCLVSVAAADFTQGSQTLSFFGGSGGTASTWQSQTSGDDTDWVSDPGGAVGGQYLYFISGRPAIGLGLDGQQVNLSQHTSDILYTDVHTGSQVHSSIILAMAKLAYPRGRWRPYIFGGVGIHHSTLSLAGVPFGVVWPASGQLVQDSSTGFAAGGGIGMDMFFREAFFIGLEYRLNLLAQVSDTPTPEAQALGFSNNGHASLVISNILLRIGIKFGA